MSERFDLKCACGDTKEHIAIFDFDEQDWKDTLSVGLYLNHYLPWYKRLVLAVKYVLGIDNTYQHYVEGIYNKDEVARLRDWLNTVHDKME